MIRYDALWHDLVRDMYETHMHFVISAEELDRMNAKDLAVSNRHVSEVIEGSVKEKPKRI